MSQQPKLKVISYYKSVIDNYQVLLNIRKEIKLSVQKIRYRKFEKQPRHLNIELQIIVGNRMGDKAVKNTKKKVLLKLKQK